MDNHVVQRCAQIVINSQIGNSSIRGFETHCPPRTTSRQHRAPIPSEVVLGFSYCEPGHVRIEADPFVFRVSIFDLATFHKCWAEVDFQNISIIMIESLCDINSVRDEHVVAFKNHISVDLDCSEGIETVEDKLMDLAILRCSDIWKRCSVCPALVGYPFALELVEAEEGVWDAAASTSAAG